MGVLAQCPVCKTRQSVKKKVCRTCGEDLDKAKAAKRVTYWISYRMPSGKQKQEAVGTSIDDARTADGKKRTMKKEGKLFDIREDAKMTFKEFSKWYLNLESVKRQKACWRTEISLNHFNEVHGDLVVGKIKAVDLENYQAKRKSQGKADHTIDHEIGAVKAMINKGFDNDMVSGETLKVFKRSKKLLKRNSNARTRILSHSDFDKLCANAPRHVKDAVSIGYHSGMRRGEILKLTWEMVDMKRRLITLPAEITKDNERRVIPMSKPLYDIIDEIKKNPPRPKKRPPNKTGAEHDQDNDRVLPFRKRSDRVLIFRGKPLKTIGPALKKACEEVGVPYGRKTDNGFVFHDLRHTFNTNMRKAGVPESVIMEITGHSTREMFDRYNTVDEEDTRNAIDQLEVFFQNVTQNVNHASNDTP
jgi:integrase